MFFLLLCLSSLLSLDASQKLVQTTYSFKAPVFVAQGENAVVSKYVKVLYNQQSNKHEAIVDCFVCDGYRVLYMARKGNIDKWVLSKESLDHLGLHVDFELHQCPVSGCDRSDTIQGMQKHVINNHVQSLCEGINESYHRLSVSEQPFYGSPYNAMQESRIRRLEYVAFAAQKEAQKARSQLKRVESFFDNINVDPCQ